MTEEEIKKFIEKLKSEGSYEMVKKLLTIPKSDGASWILCSQEQRDSWKEQIGKF